MMPESVISSGSLAVSTGANLVARNARIHFVSLSPAAADCSVRVYDNKLGNATGTLLCEIKAFTALADGTLVAPLTMPVEAMNGISYVVAGTGATAVIHYSLL